MSAFPVPRWAVSFADLTMLLLAYFVLLHSTDERIVVAAAHAAFAGEPAAGPLVDGPADAWFEPGEARLLPQARLRLVAAARKAESEGHVVVESVGRAPAGSRFDGWELGAARAAAVARALADAGVEEGRIEITIPALRPSAQAREQRLTVRAAP
jgi:flagellar motor protein MotB